MGLVGSWVHEYTWQWVKLSWGWVENFCLVVGLEWQICENASRVCVHKISRMTGRFVHAAGRLFDVWVGKGCVGSWVHKYILQ